MKNSVIVLAIVAMFGLVGCGKKDGKFAACSDATAPEDCTNAEKFEGKLECQWAKDQSTGEFMCTSK